MKTGRLRIHSAPLSSSISQSYTRGALPAAGQVAAAPLTCGRRGARGAGRGARGAGRGARGAGRGARPEGDLRTGAGEVDDYPETKRAPWCASSGRNPIERRGGYCCVNPSTRDLLPSNPRRRTRNGRSIAGLWPAKPSPEHCSRSHHPPLLPRSILRHSTRPEADYWTRREGRQNRSKTAWGCPGERPGAPPFHRVRR